MPKKFLFSLIIVLLITNIATFILLGDNKDEEKTVKPGEDEAIDVNQTAASINGEDISYDAWMKALRKEYGQKQLKQMIDHKLVQQLADEKDIKVNENVIERELSHLISTKGVMSKQEAKNYKASHRSNVKYRFQLEKLLTDDVSISDSKIKSYYEEYKDQYDFTKRIQLSHIVVSDEKTAEKVKSELDDGASFAHLAKEYSIDDDSRKDGGYLGYFRTTSEYIPAGYKDVVEDMDPYSYSDPVEAEGNVAIVRLLQVLPEITFTYDEIKPYVKNELALDKLDQNLDTAPLWEEADIQWPYKR